jgi:hypothetical protein
VTDGAETIETGVNEPVTVFSHGPQHRPIPPARYPYISNKHVIFFHNLMSEIVPDTIIWD